MALIFVFALATSFCSRSRASEIVFPSDAGIINVKTWNSDPALNAKGDGATDDTAALRACIAYAVGDSQDRYNWQRIVYFPTGTYLISDSIEGRVGTSGWSGGWRAGFYIIGQNRANTIIKLKNNCPGFTDAAAPKGVVRAGSENDGNDTQGQGERGFRNYMINFTVDTGAGNAGAKAVDWIASNRGGLQEVTIRSGDPNKIGYSGLDLTRFASGPALYKDVSISGFKVGIRVEHYEASNTFENITLSNQSEAGITTTDHPLFIRNLTSTNSVPAVKLLSNNAFVSLINANLSGGSNGNAAIQNDKGKLFVRDLSQSGYGTTISNPQGTTGDVAGATTTVSEWTSHAPTSLFPSKLETLRLPVEETPLYNTTDLSQWRNVVTDGATPNDGSNDDAIGIQAAIDAGKPIVYLPNGLYEISQTIVIRGSVQKITGCVANISRKSGFTGDIFRFDGSGGSGVVIENLNLPGPITHNSSQSLCIRLCDTGNFDNSAEGISTSASSTGKLFLEDVIANPTTIGPATSMWARQLNAERPAVNVVNNGGKAWIFGFKTEDQNGSGIRTTGGGRTELLGGLLFPSNGTPPGTLAGMEVVDSEVSLVFTVGRNSYSTLVRETRGGETRTLAGSSVPSVGSNQHVVLFSSKRTVTGPGDVNGASLWLKADAGVTRNSSDNVSLWADQSGAGNDATASGGAQSLWVDGVLNGKPVMRLNGSSHFFGLPSGFADYTQGLTAFVVSKPTAARNWARFFDLGRGAGDNNIGFARPGTSNDLMYFVYSGSNGSVQANGALPSNEPHLFEVVQQGGNAGTGTATQIYRDGTSAANGNVPVPQNVTRTSNFIGKSNWNDDLFQGDIAEVIIYPRALSDADRQAIETYLKDKYGLGVGNGTGLTGRYYSGKNFDTLLQSRTDATVDFDWSNVAPSGIGSIGATNYSVRWTGQVQAQEGGSYTFRITTDDGMRLWIGDTTGTALIDKWFDQGATPYTTTLTLVAGQKYNIKLDYYQGGGGAVAQLAWKRPGQSNFVVVPQSQLYPTIATSTPGPNLVTNPGFEAEQNFTQTPSGWGEWSGVTNDAGFSESYGGTHGGNYHGTHWRDFDYNMYSYQTKTGLANGLYTLRCWARSSGGQAVTQLEAKDFGSGTVTAPLPTGNDYQLVEIKDINVTNGQCTFGIWSVAYAYQWSYFDDFEFFKQ